MASNQPEEDNTYETPIVVIQVIFSGITANRKVSSKESKKYERELSDFIPMMPATEKKRMDRICITVMTALQDIFTDEKREIVSSDYIDDIGFDYYYNIPDEEEARMVLFRAFVSARGTSSLNWTKVLTMLAMIQTAAYRISNERDIQAVALLASHSLEFFTVHGVHNWVSNQGSGWEYLIDIPFAQFINPRLPTLEEKQFSESWVPEDDFRPRERLSSIDAVFREYARNRPKSESGPERAGCSYKYDPKKRLVPPVRPPSSDSLSPPPPPPRKETKPLGEEKFYRTTTVIVEVMMACLRTLMHNIQSLTHEKFLDSLQNMNTDLPTSEKPEMEQILGCIHNALHRVCANDTFIPAVLDFYKKLSTEFQSNIDDPAKPRLSVFRALISAHTSGTLSWEKVFLMLAIIQKLTLQISIDQPADVVQSLADFCIDFFCVHGVHEWIDVAGGGWKYLTTVKITEEFIPILPGRKEMKFASNWKPDDPGSPVESRAQSKRPMKNPSVSKAKGEKSKASSGKFSFFTNAKEKQKQKQKQKQKRPEEDMDTADLASCKEIRISSQICTLL